MTLYTDRKPRGLVEDCARAVYAARPTVWRSESASPGKPAVTSRYTAPWGDSAHRHEECRKAAQATITRLRELGFITSEGLDAIHAEEDANGEPRSSVVPGSGR